MKKTILLSSILAAGAVFAEVTPVTPTTVDSTEVGVIKLTKPTKATLIAVPFLGYEGGNIKVADMINTAELAAGTKLYVPSDSTGTLTYNVWTLSSGKKWEKPKTVDVSTVGVAINNSIPEASAATVARGGSYWLEPPAGSTDTSSFYLLGRSAEAGTSKALAGKWNLVGKASTATVTSLGAAVSRNDQVAIQVDGKLRYYIYKGGDNGWCYTDSSGALQKKQELPVALGQGLWFKPEKASTINWDNGVIAETK